jgi:ABC-type transport system involved in multi-copper enzyme maturation permease subunit
MNAPILALLSRGIRQDSRGWVTYAIRLGLAGFIAFALLGAHLQSFAVGAAGLQFLEPILYITFIFISLAALVFFPMVIAEEKEENTLGLLQMAGLSPLSVLLGKAGPKAMEAMFLVLAQVPFALLAIPLGGITASQIVAAYATLLSYVIFLNGLALFCSVVSRRVLGACVMTALLLLAFFILPPLCSFLLGEAVRERWIAADGGLNVVLSTVFSWLTDASPAGRFHEIMQISFKGPLIGVQVVSNLVMGGALFLLAWMVFGTATREQHEAAQSRGLALRLPWRKAVAGPDQRVTYRSSFAQRMLGVDRAWTQAIAWKEFHFGTWGKTGVIVKSILLAVFVAGLGVIVSATAPGDKVRIIWGGVVMGAMPVLGYLELVYRAARVFSEEVQWKTLQDIIVLPNAESEIVRQKVTVALASVIPYVFFTFVGIVISPEGFAEFMVKYGLHTAVVAVALHLTFFLYLIAFFSLLFKRGAAFWAILLAFLATYGCSPLPNPFGLLLNRTWTGQICGFLAWIPLAALVWLFHWLLSKQLRRAASS